MGEAGDPSSGEPGTVSSDGTSAASLLGDDERRPGDFPAGVLPGDGAPLVGVFIDRFTRGLGVGGTTIDTPGVAIWRNKPFA